MTSRASYSPVFRVPHLGGKELTRDAGIDLCDFEARQFDNLLFLSPDPLCHEDPATSPYAYCRNNPLLLIDPSERKTYIFATALPGWMVPSNVATHTCYGIFLHTWRGLDGKLQFEYFDNLVEVRSVQGTNIRHR